MYLTIMCHREAVLNGGGTVSIVHGIRETPPHAVSAELSIWGNSYNPVYLGSMLINQYAAVYSGIEHSKEAV